MEKEIVNSTASPSSPRLPTTPAEKRLKILQLLNNEMEKNTGESAKCAMLAILTALLVHNEYEDDAIEIVESTIDFMKNRQVNSIKEFTLTPAGINFMLMFADDEQTRAPIIARYKLLRECRKMLKEINNHPELLIKIVSEIMNGNLTTRRQIANRVPQHLRLNKLASAALPPITPYINRDNWPHSGVYVEHDPGDIKL